MGAAVLLAAAIGVQYITRGTAIRHVHGVDSDGTAVAPDEPSFALTVAMLTGAPLIPGNQVDVALNGDQTFVRLLDDLRAAREFITLQLYYGQAGHLADTLTQILMDRAAAGVRVRVLYDAFGFQRIPAAVRDTLGAAGIEVVAFRPLTLETLYRAQNRAHVRGIVIDGHVGWTGGFGIDDKWLGDGLTNDSWRETNVRVEGPAVQQLQSMFVSAWAEATGVLLSGRTRLTAASGEATAGLLYAKPTAGSTAAERFVAMSIAGARRTLYITNSYFAPDDNFIGLLADAARRGVDVRVLTAGPRTDVQTVRLAGRAIYEQLLSAGVRIYEWQPSTLHAKTFVADGVWSSIGSMNFDNRSLTLNDESTLMVLDSHVGTQMNATFVADLAHAQEITLMRFKQRSWAERVQEFGASLLQRLL